MNKLSVSSKYNGFTIVELLIVIVVIAILAAISVVAYNGIQSRANNTTIESDAATMIKKLELVRISIGHYPWTLAEMPDFKISKQSYDPSMNNVYYCADKVNDTYAVGLRSKSMKGYLVNSGRVIPNSSINGANTCTAIGKTWANDATTTVMQGYDASTGNWNSSWSWTN